MRQALLTLVLLSTLTRAAHSAWPTDVDTDLIVASAPFTQSRQVACTDGAGGMIVAWEDQRLNLGPDIYAQRIDGDGHVRWTANGVAVCTRAGNDQFLEIVSDGSGGAILTWRNENGARRVYAQHLDGGGNALWDANGRRVCTLESQQDDPHLVEDFAGGAIVLWADGRSLNANQRPIYGQRLDPAGTRLWGAAGDSLTVPGSKSNFAACSDGAGGAWLAWSDITRRPAAQRVLGSGATGPRVELVPATFSNQVFLLRVMPAGGGDAIVSIDYSGTHTLWAQRVGAGGTLPWGATPMLVCDTPTDQIDARLVSDGAGGAILAWTSLTADPEGRAQRIGADGVPRWTPNGVTIWSEGNSAYKFGIAADGAGGCVLSRSDSSGRQRAYRLSASGLPVWGATGVLISNRAANSTDPAVLPTPDGGALLAWTGTITDVDLFAKRVSGNGSIHTVDAPAASPAGGVALALASSNPVRGAARFALTLPSAATARVTLFDVQGRERFLYSLGAVAAGRHSLTLSAGDLPVGVTYVRLTTPHGSATARVVRIE